MTDTDTRMPSQSAQEAIRINVVQTVAIERMSQIEAFKVFGVHGWQFAAITNQCGLRSMVFNKLFTVKVCMGILNLLVRHQAGQKAFLIVDRNAVYNAPTPRSSWENMVTKCGFSFSLPTALDSIQMKY